MAVYMLRMGPSTSVACAALFAMAAVERPALAQARLIEVAGLPTAQALGVSGDGKVVVGTSDASPNRAFRWTELSGMEAITVRGPTRAAYATTTDGSIIAGDCRPPAGAEAIRWSGVRFVLLGELQGGSYYSRAEDMSQDGSVIVGHSVSGRGWESFRWHEDDGMISLGDLPGGNFDHRAMGVSHDGAVVVGWCDRGDVREAYRWTEAEGMVGLGDLAGGRFWSAAFDANRDGSVIVGWGSSDASGFLKEAFRWTRDEGMVGLGDFVGGFTSSGATAVNADGSVIVGYSSSDGGRGAMVWTEDLGMVPLWDLLLDAGIDPAAGGWDYLLEASDVSNDGTVIVGEGSRDGDRTSFYVELPDLGTRCFADFNADGALDVFDFLAFQNAFDAGDLAADCTEDGSLDIFDFLCFQNAFDAGCE